MNPFAKQEPHISVGWYLVHQGFHDDHTTIEVGRVIDWDSSHYQVTLVENTYSGQELGDVLVWSRPWVENRSNDKHRYWVRPPMICPECETSAAYVEHDDYLCKDCRHDQT